MMPEKDSSNKANEIREAMRVAIFYERTRSDTDLTSGTISSETAKKLGETPFLTMPNFLSFTDVKIGKELPLYEIAFRGAVYRVLVRPTTNSDKAEAFELIGTKAPGLTCDGWHLEAPTRVPNTPRALAVELQRILRADIGDIIENAFDVLQYRLHNKYTYPATLEPAGYRLCERYLMSVDAEGALTTLYETPKGVNVDLWSYFLRALDYRSGAQKLDEYAAYSDVTKEFGANGSVALRQALKLRLGPSEGRPTAHVRSSFFELFPFSSQERVVKRKVSGYLAII